MSFTRKLTLQQLPRSVFELDCLELSEVISYSLEAGKTYREKFRWENNLKQLALREFLKRPITDNVQHVRTTGSVGSGKAQPLDALVETINGSLPMALIKPGMLVMASDGKAYPVTGVFPQGLKEVFKVMFSDGASTECCADHLWAVRVTCKKHSDPNPVQVLPLRELQTSVKGWKIPICAPLRLPERQVPLDAYVLGALLGNGCFIGNMKFSSQDKSLVGEVGKRLPPGDYLHLNPREGLKDCDYSITSGTRKGHKNGPDGSYYASGTLKALRALGLEGHTARNKFVPRAYKHGSIEVRKAVLAGLLDTDGCACPGGGVEWVTASPQLAKDVGWMVQSLGGIITTRKPRVVNGWSYTRTNIKLLFNPFRFSAHKVAGWVQPTKYPPARILRAVESIGVKECQCISVASPDGTYLTNDCIVTHNTTAWIAWFYELQERYPGCSILAMRNTHGELMTALYAQIRKFYNTYGIEAHYRESKSAGAPIIELPNGSKWVFWSAQSVVESTGSDTARGLGGSEFSGALLEEVDVIPKAAVDTVVARLREKSGAWPRVIAYADNPTVDTHWLHKRFNPDPRERLINVDMRDYNQLKMLMEDNRANLEPGYIESVMAYYRDKPAQYRRFVLGEPGPEIKGDPIYGRHFNDSLHIASESLVKNWVEKRMWEDGPLCLAFDFGFRHPGLVVFQDVEIGTFRQLRFLTGWLGDSVTLKIFAQFYLDEIAQLFPSAEMVTYCDPAGVNKDPRGVTEENAIDVLKAVGLNPIYKKTDEAYGADLIIDLLREVTNHPVLGLQPAIVVDPDATLVLGMFREGYCQDPSVKKDVLKPVDDNYYIHIADAARYGVIHRRALNKNRERARQIDRTGWEYERTIDGMYTDPFVANNGDSEEHGEFGEEASYFGSGDY